MENEVWSMEKEENMNEEKRIMNYEVRITNKSHADLQGRAAA